MDTVSINPTHQAYAELQQAYVHFNLELFGSQLPSCLITLPREKRSCGYFSAGRFAHLDGTLTDEIAMNPVYFAAVPLVETMQTLAHEMCHLWQHHFGQPGRGRYHNEQWAAKMEVIGLMPSSTGRPGGKRTGDQMADYAIEGGSFLKACEELLTQAFRLSWCDRFPSIDLVRVGQSGLGMGLDASVGGGSVPAASIPAMASLVQAAEAAGAGGQAAAPVAVNRSNRLKYQCPCAKAVWGKPGLKLICGECGGEFASQAQAQAWEATGHDE